MPTYTKPYGDFVNNVDVADATKVNAQINQLFTAINGGLDGTNINTTGAPFNNYAVKAPTTATWIAPTLLNSWVNYGAGYTNANYYKDDFNIVRIQALLKSGVTTAGTILFTLPAGYRPLTIIPKNALSYNGTSVIPITIDIQTNGNVNISSISPGNTWLVLDIVFRAEQ